MSNPSPTGSITIRHVAALAGVSIKTVSRVLNSEPGVLTETQEQVRKAVAQLGYVPNQSARNLASVVTNIIGLAYSHFSLAEGDERGGHQYALILQIGALEACQQYEYGLIPIPCDVRRDAVAERLIAQVREHRLGGLIVAAPLGNTPGLLEALARAGIHHVCINPNELNGNMPYVAIDEQSAAHTMTTHLIKHGHRRIGFVKGMRQSRVSKERYKGYRDAMREHGLAVDAHWIAQGDFTFRSGVRCGEKLLETTPRVTAIFASNDDMAVGVMHAAYARGIRIPDDVSVVGFDDTELARFSWPPMTTMRQPLERMAYTAVEQLIGLMRPLRIDVTTHAAHELFPCTLITRNSVRTIEDGTSS